MRPTWIAAIVVVVLVVAGVAAYSADSTGSRASDSRISTSSHNSSSLDSSISDGSTTRSAVQSVSSSATIQSTAQYPLTWAPNSPSVGECDYFQFCIYARLGFSGTATPPPSNQTSSAATTVQGNATTPVQSSTTTIISGNSTSIVYPPESGTYPVSVFALVQDAVTGQNLTTGPLIGSDCPVQPTGFTECIAGGFLPPGHTYKITVYVTKGINEPCFLLQMDRPCSMQLLAPSRTITVTE